MNRDWDLIPYAIKNGVCVDMGSFCKTSANCQKSHHKFSELKMTTSAVLSKTQRYSVYCHRRKKQNKEIFIIETVGPQKFHNLC